MNGNMQKYSLGKKMIAFLLAITLCFQLAGMESLTLEVKAGNSVTRLEWLKALTSTFGLAVEEDNYPDNYYSDIDASSADYYDVMLATEFGLVDVEAGEALRPNEAATREFAAHTLNLCMGYVLEDENYTFAESAAVTYPEDIQVAINQGWLALSNGNFLPEQALTQEEKAAMIAAAQAVLAGDENHPENNTYAFKDSVIVLPENTEIQTIDEDTISIIGCPVEISVGDIFGCVCDGIPLAWKAAEVRTDGDETVISISAANTEDVFEEINVSREQEIDLAKLQPASEDAAMSYVVGGTKENNYEDGEVCHDLEEVGGREVTAVLVEQTADMPEAYAVSRSASPKIKTSAKITNARQKHGCSMKGAYIDFDFKVDFNCNVSVDLLEAAGISPSYELFYAPIIPGVYVKGTVDLSFYGEVNARLVEDVHLGFHYENSAARITRSFKKDSFTVTANATAKAGVRLEAGFKVPGLNGKVYGKMRVSLTAKSVHYTDGAKPAACQTISAYFYASVGYDVSVDVVIYKGTLASGNKDIYTRYNSPIRTAFHYEDGKAVPTCTRGTPGMGYAGWGYFSPVNSQYYYDGSSSGSSYGDGGGEVYTIFDYTLNEDSQATITKYRGTAVNVFVPETLDGYAVVGIGDNAFKDNKRIKSVSIADSVETIGYSAFQGCTALERIGFPENEKFVEIQSSTFYGCARLSEVEIPDSVTEIEVCAFEECTELSSVKLPKRLEKLGGMAFGDCDKITRIEIPKSLKECSWTVNYKGPFGECEGIREVRFEEGTTEIASSLFGGCTGLEEIRIPDTVTVVESVAFSRCTNLKQVTFSVNLTEIQNSAFSGCSKLESVEIPDSVTEIEVCAFEECTELSSVKLPKRLEKLGGMAFGDCDKITRIEIPKSLKECSWTVNYKGPFGECEGIREVRFEEGTTEIASSLFGGCTGLEEIRIPDTVTVVESVAFSRCTNLKQVTFSANLTEIQNSAFSGCSKLENVQIPDGTKKIGYYVFQDCTSLTEASIPDSVMEIGDRTFSGCTSLEKVHIPNTQKTITSYMFHECNSLKEINLPETLTRIENNAFYNCDALTELNLPSQVQTINANAFQDCDALTKVTIPSTVTNMGSYVFYHCDSLAEVSLGTGLTSLPSYAFAQCPKLTGIVLPYRMTKINDNAFNACTGLTEVTMPRGMASIGSQVFSYPGKMTIYGIKGTYAETYASDNGIAFVNREVHAEKADLNLTELNVGRGYGKQLFLTVTPANFTDEVTWKSGNPEIATVTEDGEIRGVSCGTTTVKVTVGNASAVCSVTVTQPVTSIRLSQSSATMAAGDVLTLTAEVYPNEATDKGYRWSSSDLSVASVSEQGEVTALAKGEAVITATATDGSGVMGTCTVSVTSQMVTAVAIEDLQSPHPYENNCLDAWQYTLNGAENLNVRFNEQTEMEDGFDYIHLYDKNNKLVGTYTGKQLAGKTVTVAGNTIRIKLETDKGGTAWGFQIDSVTAASGSGTEGPENPDTENPTTTYTYKLNTDNTITITKCISSDENIVIPSQIDGHAVTGIGDKAFENIISMKTVSFPSNLKTIGSYAFVGCTSLTSVTLPDSLTGLYTYAFSGCTSLKSAVLNRGRINIVEGLFQGCISLSSVTVPGTVQNIKPYAFSGCTSLKSLSLPKSLSVIFENAFLNSGIKTVKYAGTSTNWQYVIISGVGNAGLKSATVTGSDGKSFSADKSKWNVNTPPRRNVKKPSVSKVKSFKAKAGKKKLTLTWKKISGAAKYQIQVGTKKNFKGAKTISVSKSKKSYTKKGLKARKKYYVRIRAYKTYKDANYKTKKAYGKWVAINKKTK